MAGYVRVGSPTVFTGIVDASAGIGSGMFVSLDLADNDVTLAGTTTAEDNLYFTVEVSNGNYVGSDATAVIADNKEIGVVKVASGLELCFNASGFSSTALGTAVGLAASGAVATADVTKMIGYLVGKEDFDGAAAIQIRTGAYTTVSAG